MPLLPKACVYTQANLHAKRASTLLPLFFVSLVHVCIFRQAGEPNVCEQPADMPLYLRVHLPLTPRQCAQ